MDICKQFLKFSLSSLTAVFFRWTWVSRYQNVPISGNIGAKVDGNGGDNWSYNMCNVPVKSSPPTSQHPSSFTSRMPYLSPKQQCQSTEGGWFFAITLKIVHKNC